MKIKGAWFDILTDSRSSINLRNKKDSKDFVDRPILLTTSTRVYPYKSDMLPKMLGEFQANIVPKNGKVLQETIYVTKGTGGSLPHIIVNLSDDIPVCVRTTEEHDQALRNTFQHLRERTNATEVRSLLSMANHYSRLIKGYATITPPLRELTQKDTPRLWTERHNCALHQLKQALTNSPVTAYFDPEKDTKIAIDASPEGLGAILA